MATFRNAVRARVGPLVIVALAGGAAMCGGCAGDALVERASNEFACPRERIEVIDRGDIAAGLYDLDACGSRARYMCIQVGRRPGSVGAAVQCIHEPDPSRWDPDPTLVASLPRPPGMSDDGRLARICPRDDLFADGCLKMESGAWRWYRRLPASAETHGGLGMPDQ